MKKEITIGIYGFGAFGKLMHSVLKDHFKAIVFARRKIEDKAVLQVSKEEILKNSDYLIFAIPVQFLEEVFEGLSKIGVPESLRLIDVSSVKAYPTDLMKKYFSQNPLLGTHPIFGPQSLALYGLKGSKIVLSNISFEKEEYEKLKNFLEKKLGLITLEMSAKEHDRQMAYVQGITHFLGRAVANMDIEDFKTATTPYKHLLEIKNILEDDSWELFETIQNYNPEAMKIRLKLMKELDNLHKRLNP